MSDDLIPYDLEAPARWVGYPGTYPIAMWERCPASEGYLPPCPLPEKCFMAEGGFMVHVRSDRECGHAR